MTDAVSIAAELAKHRRYLRIVMTIFAFLTFVLIVLVVSLQLQVSARNKNIDRVTEVTQEAKEASVRAKRAVDEAIAASRSNNSGLSSKAIVDGLNAIKRIEAKVDELTKPGG